MKKSHLNITTVLLACLIIFSSCAKDEPDPEDPGSGNPVVTDPPYFRITPQPGSTISCDSAHAYVSSNVIFAFHSGGASSIEMRLSEINTGVYQISSLSGNQFEYYTGSVLYTGTGTVNITSSTSDALSGNFNCTLSGGTLTAISGNFDDIRKRP